MWTKPRKVEATNEVGFSLSIESIKNNLAIDERKNNDDLALIGTRKDQKGTYMPDTIGYLYLNVDEQKLYYSSGRPYNPVFLCDWNLDLSGGVACQHYQVHITNDGDLIFLAYRKRENPIIYPSGDYNNPKRIDFGSEIKPFGFSTSDGVASSPTNDFFMFGDYAFHSLEDENNNDPRIIWKVSKPYDNPDNWRHVHTFKHVYYESPVSDEPDNEIGHVHTVVRDFYNGDWYASTGDIDRHCRVMRSVDEGETWVEVASGGQKWRALGMTFTEEGAWWGTDSHRTEHSLYKIPRDNSGVLDFAGMEKIIDLEMKADNNTQPTYATVYLREPHGLLFLDRAEPREDMMFDVPFYSFKYKKLYNLKTIEAAPDYDHGPSSDVWIGSFRFGFPLQCSTVYQPHSDSSVYCGSGGWIRGNGLDILGNRSDNHIGALKLTVLEH